MNSLKPPKVAYKALNISMDYTEIPDKLLYYRHFSHSRTV